MPLRDLLSAQRIAVVDDRLDRRGVLAVAARLLASGLPAAGPGDAAIAAGLQAREALASTAIGHGVAMPHGRFAGLERSCGALLRLAEPVDFAATDNLPVDLVMALAVPEHAVQDHLHQLAELAEQLADTGFRDRLRAAPDADALRELLLPAPDHRS